MAEVGHTSCSLVLAIEHHLLVDAPGGKLSLATSKIAVESSVSQ